MISSSLAALLNQKVDQYNQPEFIADDPVCIPHLFSRKQDIEIMGLWAAVLAWGQRKTIIAKCKELLTLMDNAPYEFVLHHQESDLKRMLAFKHRTFTSTDTLYFLYFFQQFYRQHASLEAAFLPEGYTADTPMEACLTHFHRLFFSLPDAPERTRKHIATPERNSACKRLNLFLRWMVRKDNRGVDFGIWHSLTPAQLICPCDVHVDRVARLLGLIRREATDWKTAVELTESLRSLDPTDPVKYDYALFGLGIEGFASRKI